MDDLDSEYYLAQCVERDSEIERNRAAIDELVMWLKWSLNYAQIAVRDSYQFEQASAAITKHSTTTTKEQ